MDVKVRISVLIEDECIKIFSDSRFTVDNQSGSAKSKLASISNQYELLIVRGRTKVDAGLIRNSKLKIVGRAGVGLDNIDLQTAKEKGIIVVNTPAAPTTRVAELTVELMLCLLRKIPFADRSIKEGRGVKS